ncbi:MAG: cytochrome c oxidase assembly factor Coa1 family protein [Bacteroidota bacterium]
MRRIKWFIMLITGVLLIAVIAVIGYYKMTTKIKTEFDLIEPKQHALNLALNNQELKVLIGEPVAVDSLNYNPKREGQMQLKLGIDGIDFSANSVNLKIPLIGNNGSAWLKVVADKSNDTWNYKTLEVKVQDSETVIDLTTK